MILYCFEDTDFKFVRRRANSSWLRSVALAEGKAVGDLSIIFCSDNYLLGINRRFLSHDYYTDVITFDYCEGEVLSGDILVSVDTVRANAAEFGSSFDDELDRVMVHGLLHLAGYDDCDEEQCRLMRRMEDKYLSQR